MCSQAYGSAVRQPWVTLSDLGSAHTCPWGQSAGWLRGVWSEKSLFLSQVVLRLEQ